MKRDDRYDGPLRLRKVDTDQHTGGPGPAERGLGRDRWQGDDRTERQRADAPETGENRLRFPILQFASNADRTRACRTPAAPRGSLPEGRALPRGRNAGSGKFEAAR